MISRYNEKNTTVIHVITSQIHFIFSTFIACFQLSYRNIFNCNTFMKNIPYRLYIHALGRRFGICKKGRKIVSNPRHCYEPRGSFKQEMRGDVKMKLDRI